MKIAHCPKCGLIKKFYDGSSKCMDCHKAMSRAWYRRKREKRIAQIKEYDERTGRKKVQFDPRNKTHLKRAAMTIWINVINSTKDPDERDKKFISLFENFCKRFNIKAKVRIKETNLFEIETQ